MDQDDVMPDVSELMEEIQQALVVQAIQPDEFTASMYAEKFNLTHGQAADWLEKACKEGKLTRRKSRHNGKECWAYRRA